MVENAVDDRLRDDRVDSAAPDYVNVRVVLDTREVGGVFVGAKIVLDGFEDVGILWVPITELVGVGERCDGRDVEEEERKKLPEVGHSFCIC